MAARQLPDAELLRKLLRYEPETGKLYWRERAPELFKDGKYAAERECRRWNARYADKEALTNLREATHAQNMQNVKMSSKNRSGFKGVSWNKRDQRWAAQISINNTKLNLGYFSTREAAYEAYCRASKKHHREFGRLA